MKFISKNANLRVVLKHGSPSEPITGRQAIPGLYVKFESGVANVKDEEMIALMLAHPGFEIDYIKADDEGMADPYAISRKQVEPEHDIMEVKYGHVEKNLNPRGPMTLSQETKNILMEMAKNMAKEMAPQMAKEMLKQALLEKQSEDAVEATNPEAIEETIEESKLKPIPGKKKIGRPKKKNSDGEDILT